MRHGASRRSERSTFPAIRRFNPSTGKDDSRDAWKMRRSSGRTHMDIRILALGVAALGLAATSGAARAMPVAPLEASIDAPIVDVAHKGARHATKCVCPKYSSKSRAYGAYRGAAPGGYRETYEERTYGRSGGRYAGPRGYSYERREGMRGPAYSERERLRSEQSTGRSVAPGERMRGRRGPETSPGMTPRHQQGAPSERRSVQPGSPTESRSAQPGGGRQPGRAGERRGPSMPGEQGGTSGSGGLSGPGGGR
jgi:hypothetical protein